MAKIFTVIFLISFNCSFLFAQDKKTSKDTVLHAVYVEALGNSITYSFTYDRRFSSKIEGFGGRVGFGPYLFEGDYTISIPVQLNYLAGGDEMYFEVGGGPVLYFNSYNTGTVFTPLSSTTLYGSLTFGVRRIPENRKGLILRMCLTPVIGDFGNGITIIPYFAGISAGYTYLK